MVYYAISHTQYYDIAFSDYLTKVWNVTNLIFYMSVHKDLITDWSGHLTLGMAKTGHWWYEEGGGGFWEGCERGEERGEEVKVGWEGYEEIHFRNSRTLYDHPTL